MRPLQHLTFEAYLELLRAQFQQVPDTRDPQRISWQLHDVLLSGFAMFFSASEHAAISTEHGKAERAVEFTTALRRAKRPFGYADAHHP